MNDKPKCAWCKINAHKQLKVVSDELPEEPGHSYPVCRCPTCGNLRDSGQKSISINDMLQIYDGCLRVVSKLVSMFEEQMDCAEQTGADLAYFLSCDESENGGVTFGINSAEIVRELFLSNTRNSGGTSTRVLMNKLGIEEDYEEWTIGEREDDTWEG